MSHVHFFLLIASSEDFLSKLQTPVQHQNYIDLPTYLSIYLANYLSSYPTLSSYLSIYLSIYLSPYLSIFLILFSYLIICSYYPPYLKSKSNLNLKPLCVDLDLMCVIIF